jgi:23S rRNA-/tRNA-specific pseudouridylate synthase
MEEEASDVNSKRGMKPRSKRNRKRPRSELHTNDHLVTETTIFQLSIEGNMIPGAPLIRIVKPYPYTFSSFCKERWVGRTILEVYCKEFGSYPTSYYETAIQQGRILVSDQTVDASYKLKGKDVLSHTVHRHEPAVAVDSNTKPYIKVVSETDDIVAFDKPSTLPVHPCGGYHRNSLMNILEEETAYGKLYTIHRIDRLTSGLVVLAKTSAAAKEWGQAIQQRDCEKVYLARVKGRFGNDIPENLPHLNAQRLPNHGEYEGEDLSEESTDRERDDDESRVARRRNAHGYWMTDIAGNSRNVSSKEFAKTDHTVDEWLEALNEKKEPKDDSFVWLHLACPVRIEQPKIGICSSGLFTDLDAASYKRTVKSAQTAFAVVKYLEQDDSTLLLVKPATGRTHQIRIHLQYLGHCIANDPNYGGSLWFGNPEGASACEKSQAILDTNNKGLEVASQSLVTGDVPATESEVQRMVADNNTRGEEEPLQDFIQRTCVWCARNRGTSIEERASLEFLVRSPGLWLHALQYKVNSQSFRTELPEWSRF